jgi:TIR domain
VTHEKDFFVSYNKADRDWAAWVSWELERAGYSVIVQSWDFLPGENFVLRMHEATEHSSRTIAILSPDYLTAEFTQPEWAAAFQRDPTGKEGRLLPIRVRPCQLPGIFLQLVYLDLVGKNRETATEALIQSAARRRGKPSSAPPFPSDSISPATLGAGWNNSNLQADVHKPALSVAGVWIADFVYTDGETYREYIDLKDMESGLLLGTIVPSWDNCRHTGNVDHARPVRLRATLNGGSFITGVWFQPARSDQHGAFQLQISSESERLVGGWLKFSETRNDIVSGRWEWSRPQRRREPVIGIYGVTGAGKTTLCRELIISHKESRYFSESEVIEQYMLQVKRSDFASFRELSERGRMEIREAAFTLHSERINNSAGLIFGDAHYSFPPRRLGTIDKDNGESEQGIRTVMPDAAWGLYQAIIYLDTSASTVMERINQQGLVTPRNYWAKGLSTQDIEEWRLYEKRRLAEQCAIRGVTFVTVSGDRSVSQIASDVLRLISTIDMTAQ